MASFVFGDAETQERFREALSLPVDRDKMTLSRWIMWKLQSYGFEDGEVYMAMGARYSL